MIRGIFTTLSLGVGRNVYGRLLPMGVGIQSTKYVNKLPNTATFTSLIPAITRINTYFQENCNKSLMLKPQSVQMENVRTVVKFSWKKGKRKSVKAVPARFYRLNWGIWIRTMAGRCKKLWKKSSARKNRLQQHVFCNATQSKMLDKMVSRYWRRPKYYIEDPYEPYHKRENFYITRTKPWRPEGVDYE